MTARELEVVAPHPVALPTDEGQAVFALMQQAIDKGGDAVAALERLVDLQDRIYRRRAELEFAGALVAFQQECPVIPKSSTAKIASKAGQGYSFTFADYEQIMETLRPHLAKHGFSPTFDASATGALLTCTCTLHHRNGHSIASAFTLPTENASGATPQQKFGGALTYAKRQTLVSVLGLTMGDPDPDGESDPTLLSDDHAATLDQMLADLTPADQTAFWRYMSAASGREVTKASELREVQFPFATRTVESKLRGAKP